MNTQTWVTLLPNDQTTYPKQDTEVLAKLRHCPTKEEQEHRLIFVNEDDVSWRTAKGHAEIDFSWDVIAWQSL